MVRSTVGTASGVPILGAECHPHTHPPRLHRVVTAVREEHMNNRNQTRRSQKGGGENRAAGQQRRKNGHQRRPNGRLGSEYDQPDTGGVVAKSTLPRSVVLSFDESEAQALLLVLRASGLVDTLKYVDAKVAWTRRYNESLKQKRR